MVEAANIFPLHKVEQDAIISMHGDITIAYRLHLPEIFTLSDRDYENYHQSWIKAIRVLLPQTVFHKSDWFFESTYKADYEKAGNDTLSRSSEAFFNEREFMEHECFVFLTMKPADRKLSSSAYSNILRKSIVPAQVNSSILFGEFLDAAGQFERILTDSGYVSLDRLNDDALAGTANHPGIIERYLFLLRKDQAAVIRDIHIAGGIKIGDQFTDLYSLSDTADLPAMVGSRINYDKYSTDRTKFSVGFASPLGGLLNCNHIFNQYLFIEDEQKTLKRLESKKLRLQSLSAYSRENAISRDGVNDFLNEAIALGRQPVKAYFNVLVWGDEAGRMKKVRIWLVLPWRNWMG